MNVVAMNRQLLRERRRAAQVLSHLWLTQRVGRLTQSRRSLGVLHMMQRRAIENMIVNGTVVWSNMVTGSRYRRRRGRWVTPQGLVKVRVRAHWRVIGQVEGQ